MATIGEEILIQATDIVYYSSAKIPCETLIGIVCDKYVSTIQLKGRLFHVIDDAFSNYEALAFDVGTGEVVTLVYMTYASHGNCDANEAC